MVKTYAIFALICLFMGYLCFNLTKTVQNLKKENSHLMRSLEANVQAAKDKEQRSKNELERLQQAITDLHSIHTVCFDSPVDDDVVAWLQQLQRQYSSTLSITFTE